MDGREERTRQNQRRIRFQDFRQSLGRINQHLAQSTRNWTKNQFWDTNPPDNGITDRNSNLHLLQVMAHYYETQVQNNHAQLGRPRNIFKDINDEERTCLKDGRKAFLQLHFERLTMRCNSYDCNFEEYYVSYVYSERRFGNVIFTDDLELVLTIIPKMDDTGTGNRYSFPKGKAMNEYPHYCDRRLPRRCDGEIEMEAAFRETEEETGILKRKITMCFSEQFISYFQETHRPERPNQDRIRILVNYYWNEIYLYVLIVQQQDLVTLQPVITDQQRREVDGADWMNVSDITGIVPTRTTELGEVVPMQLSVLIKLAWPLLQNTIRNYNLTNPETDLPLVLPDIQQQ